MSKEAIIERTTTASYAASGSAILFGLTANELAAYVGIAIALATFVVNAWFKWQHLKITRKVAADKADCAVCPDRNQEDD